MSAVPFSKTTVPFSISTGPCLSIDGAVVKRLRCRFQTSTVPFLNFDGAVLNVHDAVFEGSRLRFYDLWCRVLMSTVPF